LAIKKQGSCGEPGNNPFKNFCIEVNGCSGPTDTNVSRACAPKRKVQTGPVFKRRDPAFGVGAVIASAVRVEESALIVHPSLSE